jgi:hypothetical protein
VTDAEKISKIQTMVTEWALDDNQGGGAAIDVLGEIMNLLEFDPWQEREVAASLLLPGQEIVR